MTPVLIEFIHNFSADERKKMNRFLQSPYFNTDKSIIKLYNLLEKHVSNTPQLSVEHRTLIYQKIFPKGIVTDHQLNKKQKGVLDATMGKLTALIKTFFTIESLDENIAYRNVLLNHKLLKKRHLRPLERHLKKEKKLLEAGQKRGVDYHLHEYQLEADQLKFFYQDGSIIKTDNLPDLISSLDTYYLIQKLEYQLTAISIMGVSDKKVYDFDSFDAMSSLLSLPQYAAHPLIQVYQAAIQMMKTREKYAYDHLLQLLHKYESVIPTENLVDFYKIATIFCARRIREGQPEYHRHAFNLYKTMKHKNLLLEGSFMPISKLRNIISISCHVGEFEWAKEILELYRPFIQKQIQKQIYHFNLGVIAFYQKNYTQAISHFIRVDKVHTDYDINCRVLILKSYYELDDEYDERTMQQFRSTKRFIHDNKLLKVNDKQGWKNFVSAAANLYKVRHRYGKIRLETVQKQIDNFKSINDKRWLLEKIGEMK